MHTGSGFRIVSSHFNSLKVYTGHEVTATNIWAHLDPLTTLFSEMNPWYFILGNEPMVLYSQKLARGIYSRK